jgi:fructose-1-phosphate kinase PfkB-like protein
MITSNAIYFGDHDLVETFGGLFQQINNVAIPKRRVQAVDPHGEGFGAPIHGVNSFNNVGAGDVFVGGCYAVFQIQIDHIRSRCGHLCK